MQCFGCRNFACWLGNRGCLFRAENTSAGQQQPHRLASDAVGVFCKRHCFSVAVWSGFVKQHPVGKSPNRMGHWISGTSVHHSAMHSPCNESQSSAQRVAENSPPCGQMPLHPWQSFGCTIQLHALAFHAKWKPGSGQSIACNCWT